MSNEASGGADGDEEAVKCSVCGDSVPKDDAVTEYTGDPVDPTYIYYCSLGCSLEGATGGGL